jgi:hypothetical protein
MNISRRKPDVLCSSVYIKRPGRKNYSLLTSLSLSQRKAILISKEMHKEIRFSKCKYELWHIYCKFYKDNSINVCGKVGTIPDMNIQGSLTGRLNASLRFVSEDMAVIGDGAGKLFVYHTGARNSTQEWKVSLTNDIINLINRVKFS